MPLKTGKDSEGSYVKYGDSGKKYHYTAGDAASRERAKKKALKQAAAMRATGYSKGQ